MKRALLRIIALMLSVASLISLAACGHKPPFGNIPDIPDMPAVAPLPPLQPVASDTIKDVPPFVAVLSVLAQAAACVAVGALAWMLYQDSLIF
jgi:predicted small lipoprotein YifL